VGVAGDSTSVFSRFFLNRGVFSGIIGSRRSWKGTWSISLPLVI